MNKLLIVWTKMLRKWSDLMEISKVVNKENEEILFTGSHLECQAFLKGMYTVDSSDNCLWFNCFIETN